MDYRRQHKKRQRGWQSRGASDGEQETRGEGTGRWEAVVSQEAEEAADKAVAQ